MKVYTFIFAVGFLNLTVPFLGIPFVYKNYFLLSLAALTIGYALIVRAIEKEKQNYAQQNMKTSQKEEKTIEEVVYMEEEKPVPISISDVKPRARKSRKKVVIQEHVYE
jgi:hypothetical protein